MSPRVRGVRLLVPVAALLAGCGDSQPAAPADFELDLSASSITLAQGATGTVTVQVARTNLEEPVALTVEGLPSGVTASFEPASVPSGTPSSVLTLSASGGAAPGSTTLTVRGQAPGVEARTASLELTVEVAGTFTLAVSPATVDVERGGSATATLQATRTGGFAGTVELTATGAPAGVAVAFEPSALAGTATTSAVTVSAAGDAPTGTHEVTLRGNATGVAEQTSTLTVQVAAPPTTGVTVAFCPDEAPEWFAYRNEGGSWTRVEPGANDEFTFAAAERVSIATVHTLFGFSDVSVVHALAAEVDGIACVDPIGDIAVDGSVAGLDEMDLAIVSMGLEFAAADQEDPDFQLLDLPDGPLDLLGIRFAGPAFAADRVILRRDQSPASGSTLPVLDFDGAEAMETTSATLTIGNAGGDEVEHFTILRSAAGTYALFSLGEAADASIEVQGLPSSATVAGDVHWIGVTASPGGEDPVEDRGLIAFSRDVADGTLALGPPLATPTVTTVSGASYARFRVELPVQSEYGAAFSAWFEQGSANRIFSITATPGFFVGSPATWDVTIPDFTGVPGWDDAWGLEPGLQTEWEVGAAGGDVESVLGGVPADGTALRFGSRRSATTALYRRLPSQGVVPAPADLLPAPLFRRARVHER